MGILSKFNMVRKLKQDMKSEKEADKKTVRFGISYYKTMRKILGRDKKAKELCDNIIQAIKEDDEKSYNLNTNLLRTHMLSRGKR